MVNLTSCDIETTSREASQSNINPNSATCTKSRQRTAVILSATLTITATAIAAVLSSKSRNAIQPTQIHAQDVSILQNNISPITTANYWFTPCKTEAACNAQRQALGFERYIKVRSNTKGCFSRRNIAYYSGGGSDFEISKADLPGRMERIWCHTEDRTEVFGLNEISTSSVGETVATYLAPFKRMDVKGNGPNIELADGTFYEMINLPSDYDDSTWITGVTTIAIPIGAEFTEDGFVDMKGLMPQFVANEDTRSESRFEGIKTLLAIRVVAENDRATTVDELNLSDALFGTGVDEVNLSLQFRECSMNKLQFVKASNKMGKSTNSRNVMIVNGVATIHVPIKVSEGTAVMRNAISKELNTIFGTSNPRELADYVIYCLPPGAFNSGTYSNVGYAYYNNWLSVFNDKWCTSLSLGMHELGHSLNFGHSNENDVTYEDGSGNMGASYKGSDRPRMCFNAAKSWQTGWYADKAIVLGEESGLTCFAGVIHGIVDYAKATTVLLKIPGSGEIDLFVNFNSKKGMNQGTQEGGNQVTVVSRIKGERDSFAESNLVAKLSAGDVFEFEEYVLSVVTIDVDVGTAEVTVLHSDCK